MKIDFDNKQIFLFDGNNYKISSATDVLPIKLKSNYPFVECSIEIMKGKIIPIEQVNILPSQINGEVVCAIVLFVIGLIIAMKLGGSSEKSS